MGQVIIKGRPSYNIRRRKLEAFLEPQLSNPYASHPATRCKMRKELLIEYEEKEKQLVPFERAMANMIRSTWMKEYPNVAVCQRLPLNTRNTRLLQGRLWKDGLALRQYPNNVMAVVFNEQPSLHNLIPLCVAPNFFIFTKHFKFVELLKHVKQTPQMTLLAYAVDDRILSPTEVQYFAGLESAQVLTAESVRILASATAETPTLLSLSMLELTRNLHNLALSAASE